MFSNNEGKNGLQAGRHGLNAPLLLSLGTMDLGRAYSVTSVLTVCT